MANGHGGKREGSGRTRKRVTNAGAVAAAEKQIRDRLPEIIDAQIKLALGVKAVRLTDEGEEIYTTVPDVKAAQYLTDRLMGKPLSKQEITGANGNELSIKVKYDDSNPPL